MATGLEALNPNIANILGGGAARQAARAASQRQPAPYVDEEEERSLIRSLRDNSLTTVGAIGNFLDLPGSAVRDVGSMIATGKWVNPVDQFIFSPFSSENRTTGKDLLQQTGLAGGKESWGKSIAGFGLEMAMDPLTYMTLGASAYGKAGQAAAKFGLADEAVRVATKKAGAAPGSIGAREARLTTTAQDIAANSTGITKKRADDFLKTLTPEEAAQPLGGMIGIGLPFMQPKAVFGTGPKSIAAAKGLDAAGRAIRFGKIPGTDIQNPIGAMLGLFDAPAKRAKTAEGAFAARELFRNAPRNEATLRGNAANMSTAIADVTQNLDSDAAKEVDTYLRSRPWYVEPKNLDERHSLISDAILEAGELASENPALIDSLPKSIQWITDQMKYDNSLLPGKTRRAGGAVTELNDNIDYMARYASIGGKIKSSIGEDASTFDPSFGYRRLDYLRDIPGGTVAFKRGIVMDKVLRDMIKDKVGIDAVADYLRTKHSDWLPDTYTSFYQAGKNKGKAYTKTGRYDAMAKMLYGQDADVLERGLFGNSVVFDHLNRQLGSIRQTSTLDNIADLLSSKTPEGSARYIKTDADWKAAGADIGSPDDTTMSMQKFLKTMGLPAYAIHNVLKTGKPKKGGFLRALGKKMGIDHKELRHARIDKRIADDLIRIHKATTTRGPGEEILEMTDSVTNLTKGMLTSDWPSFHVRNIVSGWAQNAMLGMWDKQSAGWAGQIMVGNAMKGSSKVEWTGREYARRARAAGWDDVAIADKLKKTGYSQAQINQFLSQAGKARKTTPPGPPGASGPTPPGPQGPGPIPPQSPPGQVGPRGPSPQGPIPPGQVSPATAPPASAVDPLVADADALLAKIDAGGAMPAMITGSLRKLAKAVGVDVTNKMKPADVVEAIRQARKSAPPGTQAVSADLPSPVLPPEGGFYSKLKQATQEKVGGRIDWQQFQKTMKGAGVKDEEIADIGMEDFFKTGPKTKKEVEQYIEANTPEIEIIEKGYAGEGAIKQTGQARFEGYSIPGGEPGTYREVLIKLPIRDNAAAEANAIRRKTEFGDSLSREDVSRLRELETQASETPYTGPHWEEPNVIAHLRVDDIVNPDGTKTLRVTEVQSDWHQAGRRDGYVLSPSEEKALDDATNYRQSLQRRLEEIARQRDSLRLSSDGDDAVKQYMQSVKDEYRSLSDTLIPDAIKKEMSLQGGDVPSGPFKKSWSKLAIKQALRMAVEEGYDEVGLVVGRDAAKAVGGPAKELDEAYRIMLKDAKDYTKKYGSYVGETEVVGASKGGATHDWSAFDSRGVSRLTSEGVEIGAVEKTIEDGKPMFAAIIDGRLDAVYVTQEEARRAVLDGVNMFAPEYDGGLHIFKITDEMRRDIGEQGQSFYLPNPKAGSLFESASETPVDRTGFTPAQVGFESANMPRPAAGDPWNKKLFSERSAEHAKFGKALDSLVRSKSIQQKHADLLRVAFFGASEEGMKIMNMPKFGGRAKIGPSDPAGRWTAKVNRVTGEIIEPQILIRKDMPEGQSAFNTMLHELSHMGHAVLKRDLGKAWSDNFDETLKKYRESGELLRYFESVHGKEIGRYLASTPNENFAQLIADSITRRKVPEGAIGKIITDIRDWIVAFLERIKLTTPLPTELNTFIDEIADSMLGYDGKKLSDLVTPPKAAVTPSQVSPVPSVPPVPQVPGVQPVSPITSTPTPVPVGAVAPTPGSVGPPTGPPAPPVVPPGPPGPPMGPPPRPPRKPVRGVDSTFPDPATGALPDLDDTLATTMLGQRAYADGVIGSIDADRAGDLAGNFEVKSGTVREMLGGIPRPGYKSFSAYRTVAKALGFEPGTTYNPLHRRGVGGRTATNFSIGAAGEEVGHFGEGLVRLQPWFALIKKGYDPSVAAEKVAAAQVAYSNRNFTDFELKYMRRLLPFYKFSRQQIPFQMKQLMEKPGGSQAQLIRGLNQAQSQGELAPDYVRDTASIPVSDQNPILKSIIGAAPEGTDRYLSGLGLMAEDLSSVGPGVRGTGQEFLSRLNPMIKGPLEYFTNQSFFQAGPEGGRPLDEMDPLIGRTIANLTGQKDPVKLPQILEVAAANSPISRFLTTARTLTDPRKRSTMSPIPLPGAAAAINLLTGARVTDVSPGSKDAIVRDLLNSRMKATGARAFERINYTKEDLAKMSPSERETALQLQGLANVIVRRSKERAAERKKAEGN